MAYRHFVFDLDGTLIDSRQDLADAANALLALHGVAPLPVADVAAMVGEGARTLVERVLRRAGLITVLDDLDQALADFLDAYDQRLAVHTHAYEGVTAMLAHLADAGCYLSVLTNKPQQATDRVLDALGLRAPFTAVTGGDTSWGRKPEPHGLLALINASGHAAEQTLMVGDSWVDARTAAAAGVDACLVTYGFGYAGVDDETRERVRWQVSSPRDLMALAAPHPPTPLMPPETRA